MTSINECGPKYAHSKTISDCTFSFRLPHRAQTGSLGKSWLYFKLDNCKNFDLCYTLAIAMGCYRFACGISFFLFLCFLHWPHSLVIVPLGHIVYLAMNLACSEHSTLAITKDTLPFPSMVIFFILFGMEEK